MIDYNNAYGVLLHEYDREWLKATESITININDELKSKIMNRAISSRRACIHLINKDIKNGSYDDTREKDIMKLLNDSMERLQKIMSNSQSDEDKLIKLSKAYRILTSGVRIAMNKNT